MSVHHYLLRPKGGDLSEARLQVAEVGVANKVRMRSGHVGFFEAEEQVTVQVRIALGVDEERVADAALSMGNVFLERERSRSSGSPLAAPAPLPNRLASTAGPPSARVIRCVTRVSIRRRTVPLPVRAGSVSARGVLVNRTTEGAHHDQLHWLVAHYLRPGPCPEIDRRVAAVKFPANDNIGVGP
jgi:hypothetical protein